MPYRMKKYEVRQKQSKINTDTRNPELKTPSYKHYSPEIQTKESIQPKTKGKKSIFILKNLDIKTNNY